MNEKELKRLSDCEVMMNKYHDQLQKFIDQVINYNKQIVPKGEFETRFDNLEKEFTNNFGEIRLELSDIFLEHKDLGKLVEDIKINSKECQGYQKNQQDQINLLKNLVVQNSSQYTENKNRSDLIEQKIAHYEKISPEIDKIKLEMINFIQDLSKKHGFIEKKIEVIEGKNKHYEGSLYGIGSEMSDFRRNMSLKFSESEKKHEINCNDIESRFLQFQRKINVQIDQIKLPEPIKSADPKIAIDEIKADLEKAMQSMVLDVSNAKTKSDVNEMQMKIFEKKLDNIYLLLKKNELTQ